jgi:hypothetical protein
VIGQVSEGIKDTTVHFELGACGGAEAFEGTTLRSLSTDGESFDLTGCFAPVAIRASPF